MYPRVSAGRTPSSRGEPGGVHGGRQVVYRPMEGSVELFIHLRSDLGSFCSGFIHVKGCCDSILKSTVVKKKTPSLEQSLTNHFLMRQKTDLMGNMLLRTKVPNLIVPQRFKSTCSSRPDPLTPAPRGGWVPQGPKCPRPSGDLFGSQGGRPSSARTRCRRTVEH